MNIYIELVGRICLRNTAVILNTVPRAIRYLPLAFAIKLIGNHHVSDYVGAIDKHVDAPLSLATELQAPSSAVFSNDLQLATYLRLNHWSDLLASALTPQSLSVIVFMAFALAVIHIIMDVFSHRVLHGGVRMDKLSGVGAKSRRVSGSGVAQC